MDGGALSITPEGEIDLDPAAPAYISAVEALGDRIGALAARHAKQEAELIEAIGVFDEAGGWFHQGAVSCAHWLAWKVGMALATAREKVRTARALRALPEVAARFRAGTLSYSKVRALTRVATPDAQSSYLDIADATTASQLDRICRRQAAAEEAARAAEDPAAVAERRQVQTTFTDEGWLRLRALLPPDEGAQLDKRLDLVTARLRKEGAAVTRADALLHLLELGFAHLDGPSTLAPPSAEIILHATEESLAERLTPREAPCPPDLPTSTTDAPAGG
jgi:hypothetical protein